MHPPRSGSGSSHPIPSAWHRLAFLCLRNLRQRDVTVPWAASVTAWRLCGGGHSGGSGGSGDGDNGSSGDSDVRGRIAGAGRDRMTVCDGDEARAHTADNAGTGTTAKQFACTWAALWGKWERESCWAH